MTRSRLVSIDDAVRAVLDFVHMESYTEARAQATAKRIWQRLFTECASFPDGIPVVGARPWLDEWSNEMDFRDLRLSVYGLLYALAEPQSDGDRRLSIDGADFTIKPLQQWNRQSAEARDGAPRAVVDTALITVLACDRRPRESAIYLVVRLLERLGRDRLLLCPAARPWAMGTVRCGRLFLKVGRKEYCSTMCQQRENQRRHRA